MPWTSSRSSAAVSAGVRSAATTMPGSTHGSRRLRPRRARRPPGGPPRPGPRREPAGTRRRGSGTRPQPSRRLRARPGRRSCPARRSHGGQAPASASSSRKRRWASKIAALYSPARAATESRVARISVRTRSSARSSSSHSASGSLAGSVGISGVAARKWRAAPIATPGATGIPARRAGRSRREPRVSQPELRPQAPRRNRARPAPPARRAPRPPAARSRRPRSRVPGGRRGWRAR